MIIKDLLFPFALKFLAWCEDPERQSDDRLRAFSVYIEQVTLDAEKEFDAMNARRVARGKAPYKVTRSLDEEAPAERPPAR